MSDTVQTVENEEKVVSPADKLKPDDKSLSLVQAPRVNKKMLKMAAGGLGAMATIGLIFGFAPPSPGEVDEPDAEEVGLEQRIPSDVMNPMWDFDQEPDPEEVAETREGPRQSQGEIPRELTDEPVPQRERYETYTRETPERTVDVEERAPAQPSGFASSTADATARALEEDYRRAGLFHSVDLGETSAQGTSEEMSQEELLLEAMKVQGGTESTDFERQNQQRQNVEWLANREQTFSDYASTPASYAVAPGREVKAGSSISITMITAINSDLPGEIVAQVNENIYDTMSGQNLLIPRGSRVVGNYSSSVAFGQDRALVAWERIIRPDGVSLRLEGMRGHDIQGRAGMADTVDRHISEMASAIGMASLFDLTLNSSRALLASNRYFSALGDAIGVEGKREIVDEIAEQYVERVLNRQPTIHIREGFRGTILVNKDLVIPPYEDWRGGF